MEAGEIELLVTAADLERLPKCIVVRMGEPVVVIIRSNCGGQWIAGERDTVEQLKQVVGAVLGLLQPGGAGSFAIEAIGGVRPRPIAQLTLKPSSNAPP